MIRRPPRSPLFPSPTLFRSRLRQHAPRLHRRALGEGAPRPLVQRSEIRLARTRRRCSSRRRAAHEGEDMKKALVMLAAGMMIGAIGASYAKLPAAPAKTDAEKAAEADKAAATKAKEAAEPGQAA